MKIRNGFVSNSSSSSFVLALTTAQKCPTCGRSDTDLLELIRTCDDDESCIDAVGTKEVLAYIKDWADADLVKKVKATGKKPGSVLAVVSISYHNSTLADLLETSKNVEVLHNDN